MIPMTVIVLAASVLLTECSSSPTTPTKQVTSTPPVDTQPTPPPPPPPPTQNLVLGGLNARSIVYNGQTYKYQLFIPKTYTSAKQGSILMVFHGSGTRGSDNQLQMGESFALDVKSEMSTFPSITIFPQAPMYTREGDFVPIAFAILDQELKALNGDPNRVYLFGYSYGGYLVYDMAYAQPSRIAALVTMGALMDPLLVPGYPGISKGAAYTAYAQQIRGVPIWSFQGENDPYTLATEARIVFAAQKAAGDNVTYTEFPGGGHDVVNKMWTTSFFNWLWAQHR
jgi:predicted peptidase